MRYVNVEVVKDGNYYSVNLIDERNIRYPIAMVRTPGEAEHIKDVELQNLNSLS